MTTNLVTPQDFNTKVTEKVRQTFMDLIPEETLNKLVTDEINAFFNVTSKNFTLKTESTYRFNDRSVSIESTVSPFRLLVWNEVQDLVRPALNKIFESDEWRTEVVYDSVGQQEIRLNEMLDEKLEKFVTVMAKSMFQNAFGAAVEEAKREAQNEIVTRLQNNGVQIY